ncbi:MAG: hypothetical protein OSB19_06505 [Opitutaceae bacterium]|nr:hypothetical protein [Opitutaceae bacterium]
MRFSIRLRPILSATSSDNDHELLSIYLVDRRSRIQCVHTIFYEMEDPAISTIVVIHDTTRTPLEFPIPFIVFRRLKNPCFF